MSGFQVIRETQKTVFDHVRNTEKRVENMMCRGVVLIQMLPIVYRPLLVSCRSFNFMHKTYCSAATCTLHTNLLSLSFPAAISAS